MARILVFAVLLIAFQLAKAGRYACPARTSLATFNAALIPIFPGAGRGPELEDRTQLLIEQIKTSNADILCLQEVFDAGIQREIYRAVNNEYPFIQSVVDLTVQSESEKTACTVEDLQRVLTCVVTECPTQTGSTLFACYILRCLNTTASLNPPCRDCVNLYLLANQTAQCLTLAESRFETSYGLMLLSKKELQNQKASGFIPQSQFRGYLESSVDGVGNLTCTHLTALTSTQFYAGPPFVSPLLYSNYEAQQYAELTTLFELVTSMENPVLMGDFNNGPASPGENFAWELPFHYGLLTARGFVSPYVLEDGRCTFCKNNPSANFPSDLVIDHVYVTTDMYKRVLSAKRILDDVMTKSGSPLSDHYGVMVTLKDIHYNCRWWQTRLFYCPAERLQLTPLPAPQNELNRICAASSG